MKSKYFVFLLLLFFAQPGWALLAPLAQSSVEIKRILDSEEFSRSLGAGEVIESIKHEGDGYEISTTNYTIYVKVIPVESHLIGPKQFKLEFGEPIKSQK